MLKLKSFSLETTISWLMQFPQVFILCHSFDHIQGSAFFHGQLSVLHMFRSQGIVVDIGVGPVALVALDARLWA
jgi:hypothetical protein